MPTRHLAILTAVIWTAAAGCARYEYEIASPAEFRTRVGTKTDAIVTREPLNYLLRTVENRLVMRVENNSTETLQFLGDRSSIVDPSGQSHPLRSQPIPPASYMKLILPPLRPSVLRPGPSIGFGMGGYVATNRSPGYDNPDPDWAHEPVYLSVIEDDSLYWEWDGEGEVRLSLMFQQAQKTFTQDFVIQRIKLN